MSRLATLTTALLAAAGLLLATAPAHGQANCDYARQPRCGDEYQKAPCQPPSRAPQDQPQGAFVAPPQSGVVQGASEGYGVRGLELEFPALRLRLPSLHFPSLFATRDNPRMLLDAAHAPYVQGNFAGFPTVPAYGGQPSQAPQDQPQQAPKEPDYYPPMQSPRQAPECNALYSPQPSAERLAIEQRLRALEETERRLGHQLHQLQHLQQQLAAQEAQRTQQQLFAAGPYVPAGDPRASVVQPVHHHQALEQVRRPGATITAAPRFYPPQLDHGPLALETVSRLPRVEE